MEVLQIIQGREAVPVRAIPFLTDWKILSPDKVARILAGEDDFWPTLNAYRLQPDGIVKQILPRWWASWVVGKLKATSDAIKVQQISQAVGTEQWKRESIEQLPAGVFVWRDEFEDAHLQQYGALSMLARSAPKTFDASTYALDFNPEPPPDIAPQHLVLEGFAPANPQAATPVTVVDTTSTETTPSPQTVTVAQTEAAQVVELPHPSAGPIETPEERRARWLDMFEKMGGADKRGALAELSRELNVDRSNLKKDLNKAEEHRKEKRREGAFGVAASQLVRNGKRRT